MSSLNETPSGVRLHIGVFGRTNSGKSSFVNALTGQQVSIVSNVAGTTTDPVSKPMEINPLGACVLIDTAGFDDESELGKSRVEKTRLAAEKSDIGVIIFDSMDMEIELQWFKILSEKKTPVLPVISRSDCRETWEIQQLSDAIKKRT